LERFLNIAIAAFCPRKINNNNTVTYIAGVKEKHFIRNNFIGFKHKWLLIAHNIDEIQLKQV